MCKPKYCLGGQGSEETEDERLARLEEVAEVSDDLLEDEDDGPLLPPGDRSITELANDAANSLGNLLLNSVQRFQGLYI